MFGVREECVKISDDNYIVILKAQGDKDFIEECGFEKYVCSIDLSNKLYNISNIYQGTYDQLIKNVGFLELAIPKLKPEDVIFDVKVDVLTSS